MNTYEGWHFLAERGKLRDGSAAGAPGEVETYDGNLVMCERGLHACARPIDALQYAPGSIVRRVRLSGTIIVEGDKAVASKREIIAEADGTRVLHLFVCWCAERVLDLIPEAKRTHAVNAIATKRRWLDGNATYEELSAARAATDAARAATDASWAASWAAWAADASWDATWAANVAWDAAASWAAHVVNATRAEQNAELERLLTEAIA